MAQRHGAVTRGIAALLLALAVSPITAPFSAIDWQLALYGQVPHEGASLKVKAPDSQPVATTSTVTRPELIADNVSRRAGPEATPGRERLPIAPPLRL